MTRSSADRDKRQKSRYALELPVTLNIQKKGEKQRLRGFKTKNISSGGALIKTKQVLSTGTGVDVSLVLPLDRLKRLNSDFINIDISGHVSRVEKEGLVIEFNKTCHISRSTLNTDKNTRAVKNSLTPRENEILDLICSGFTNKEIGVDLSIGLSTVKAHIYNLYKKIGVSNRFQAILWRSAQAGP